jgi:diguanylate cyclase (GGDEF)-like protein
VQRLRRLAETDPLTGLANRRFLDQLLDRGSRVFDRRGDLAVAMLDIDHFKRINDTRGHGCGDQVLRCLARVIRLAAPREAVTCRWGGEEFLVLMPGIAQGEAVLWCERVGRTLGSEARHVCGEDVEITLSAGVDCCAADALGSAAIDRADQALYLAKSRGRDQVCTWPMVVFDRLLEEMG